MEALGFEDEELHNAIDEQVVDLDNVGAAGETEVVENDPVGGCPEIGRRGSRRYPARPCCRSETGRVHCAPSPGVWELAHNRAATLTLVPLIVARLGHEVCRSSDYQKKSSRLEV